MFFILLRYIVYHIFQNVSEVSGLGSVSQGSPACSGVQQAGLDGSHVHKVLGMAGHLSVSQLAPRCSCVLVHANLL